MKGDWRELLLSEGAQIFTGTAAAPEINCYTLNYLFRSIVAPGQTAIQAHFPEIPMRNYRPMKA